MTAIEFYDALRSYCAMTGGSVVSFGRTWHHNRKVGGVVNSPHLFWRAADIVYDIEPPALGGAWAERLGLRLIREGDHDHVQPSDWEAG